MIILNESNKHNSENKELHYSGLVFQFRFQFRNERRIEWVDGKGNQVTLKNGDALIVNDDGLGVCFSHYKPA
jgi:hypothetical protein